MTRKVIIVDYGVGNLRSVTRAVTYCGADPVLTSNAKEIYDADTLILPGVGAFGSCIAALKKHEFIEPIMHVIGSGRPVLGICVGMQMLLDESEEFGLNKGLGLISGKVSPIPATKSDDTPHKIPHIGWSGLEPADITWRDGIMKDIMPGDACYFVHSFAANPINSENCLAYCNYNGRKICAAVKKDNLFGVQFHPEKSGTTGLNILSNFIALSY